jgi:NADP-dependent 3-hydroxy acid dehydrogenase YdfG
MMVFITGPTDGFGRAIAKRWERSFIRSLSQRHP